MNAHDAGTSGWNGPARGRFFVAESGDIRLLRLVTAGVSRARCRGDRSRRIGVSAD
jgi:hypothetical protein